MFNHPFIQKANLCTWPVLAKLIWLTLLVLLTVLLDGLPARAGDNQWTQLGPYGGSIRALAIHPIVPDTLYAGTEGASSFVITFRRSGLSLIQSVTPTIAKSGNTLTYVLTFFSTDVAATGVVITDTIPISLTNISVVSSGAVITPMVGTHYIWNVQNLAPHQGGVITITGVLSQGLPLGAVFTNTATITGTDDNDPTDNEASAGVTIGVETYLPIIVKNNQVSFDTSCEEILIKEKLWRDLYLNLTCDPYSKNGWAGWWDRGNRLV